MATFYGQVKGNEMRTVGRDPLFSETFGGES
jgi:hypothetical protein